MIKGLYPFRTIANQNHNSPGAKMLYLRIPDFAYILKGIPEGKGEAKKDSMSIRISKGP